MRKDVLNTVISAVVTVVVLILLFTRVDLQSLMSILGGVDYRYLLLGVLSYVGLNLVLALRLFLLLRELGHDVPYRDMLMHHFSAMILGDVTPGKIGYFGMILMLRDRVPGRDAISVLTVSQIMDFIMKIVGTITFFLIMSHALLGGNQNILLAGIFLVAALTVVACLLLWSEKSLRVLRLFDGIGFVKRILNILEGVQESSHKLKPMLLVSFIISVLGWILVGGQWYFLGLSVGLLQPYWFFFLLQSVISTVAFIPVSLGGMGIQESAGIAVLLLMGFGYTRAFVFNILTRGVCIIVDAVMGVFNLRKLAISDIFKIWDATKIE